MRKYTHPDPATQAQQVAADAESLLREQRRSPEPPAPVQPGDIIMFLGTPHLIDSVDERTKSGDPIARAADGWGITLNADGTFTPPTPNKSTCHLRTVLWCRGTVPTGGD